jgi:hypothetical protein
MFTIQSNSNQTTIKIQNPPNSTHTENSRNIIQNEKSVKKKVLFFKSRKVTPKRIRTSFAPLPQPPSSTRLTDQI